MKCDEIKTYKACHDSKENSSTVSKLHRIPPQVLYKRAELADWS